MTTTEADPTGTQSVGPQWRRHLIGLGFLLVVILTLFWQTCAAAVQVWWVSPTFSHCFLIIPISLWLIWNKRDELKAQMPALEPRALWVAPFLLSLWLVGEFVTNNELRQIAVIGLIQVAIVAMLGMRVYRMILFPALFLFFSVPIGEYFITPLQKFTTSFVDHGLNILNVPHYTEGTSIELTNGRFEIAEACAGLRFLIATVALGTIFAYLTFRRWSKIVLFLIACVIVPIIGNGLRALGIILLAHITDNKLAVGADHIVYGWGFSVIIMLILFVIGMRFRDPIAVSTPAASEGSVPSSRLAIGVVALSTGLAIAVAPALSWWRESSPIRVNSTDFANPLHTTGWAVGPARGTWYPVYNLPDAQLSEHLMQLSVPAAPAVDLVVEYFGRVRDGHKLISSTNYLWDIRVWQPISSRDVTTQLGIAPIDMTETTISSGLEKRLVWSSYWVGGHFTKHPFIVKLLQLEGALSGNDAAALIAISTPINSTPDDARQRLDAAMSSLQELPTRLVSAGQDRSGDGQP